MFIIALFTITKTRKQPKWLSVDKWIKKIFHIFTIEYYSVINKMKFHHLWQHGWVDHEGIMLSKISQMGKNKYDFIHIWSTIKPKQIKTKK